MFLQYCENIVEGCFIASLTAVDVLRPAPAERNGIHPLGPGYPEWVHWALVHLSNAQFILDIARAARAARIAVRKASSQSDVPGRIPSRSIQMEIPWVSRSAFRRVTNALSVRE